MAVSWRKESVYRDGSLNYGRLALYAIMIFVAIIWGAPFIWMFVTSIKPDTEVFSYPPTWWPDQPTLEFYTRLFDSFPMLQWFRNSLIVATITTALTLATNILAAYPLARMRFRGRKIVLLIILSTFLLPGEILLVPLFLGMIKFKLANTYFSIAVPAAANAFGVFLMTQFFLTIPVELEEAGPLGRLQPLGFALAHLHPTEQAGHRHRRHLHLRPQLERFLLAAHHQQHRRDPHGAGRLGHFRRARAIDALRRHHGVGGRGHHSSCYLLLALAALLCARHLHHGLAGVIGQS